MIVLFEPSNRLQGGCQGTLGGNFRHIQKHACDLDTPFINSLLQSLNLFRGAAVKILPHGPGNLTGPAEFRIVRIIVGQVAVVQDIINVA